MEKAPEYVNSGKGLIWGNLLHLSRNFWSDRAGGFGYDESVTAKPLLEFDIDVWNELTQRMSDAGMNMIVIDLGDGVKYDTHPEIALGNAWSKDKLKEELVRLRKLGLEPIPKLNFSATHDVWMGPYSRCVSSGIYYKVCANLIAEVIELFEKPRFFHLGMDEETYGHQMEYEYIVIRQFDLWWHDMLFFAEQVEKGGSLPWIWADYVWHHAEEFWKRMPKSVVQSNWYYWDFKKYANIIQYFVDLDWHEYYQIPTGSNWESADNFGKLVEFCKRHNSEDRLLGFLQTPWKPTTKEYLDVQIEAIDVVGKAMANW